MRGRVWRWDSVGPWFDLVPRLVLGALGSFLAKGGNAWVLYKRGATARVAWCDFFCIVIVSL